MRKELEEIQLTISKNLLSKGEKDRKEIQVLPIQMGTKRSQWGKKNPQLVW